MQKVILRNLVIIALVIISFSAKAQDNNILKVDISFEIPQLANKPVLIAYPFWGKTYISDTVFLDKDGKGTLVPARGMEKGVYKVVWPPSNHYAEFIVDSEKSFSFRIADIDNYIFTTSFSGSEQNNLFYQYLQFLVEMKRQKDLIEKDKNLASEVKNTRTKQLDMGVRKIQDSLVENTTGTLFSAMLRLASGYGLEDRTDYFIYRKHYLENIDLADARLARTEILYDRVITYIEQLNDEKPDSVFAACELLIEKARPDKNVFQQMVTSLLNKYATGKSIFGEDVYALIGNKYYVEEKPDWVDEATRLRIEQNVKKILPNRIGYKAPDFTFKDIHDKPFILHQHVNTGVILFFYDATRTGIGMDLKKLADAEKKYKQRGISFIAVILTPADKPKAIKQIADNGIGNCINLISDNDSLVFNNYHIVNGFKLLMLDMDKKIMYKNISLDNIPEVLDHYLN